MKLTTACSVLLAGCYYSNQSVVTSFQIQSNDHGSSTTPLRSGGWSSDNYSLSRILCKPLFFKTGSEMEDSEPTTTTTSDDVFGNTLKTLRTFIPKTFVPQGSGMELREDDNDDKKTTMTTITTTMDDTSTSSSTALPIDVEALLKGSGENNLDPERNQPNVELNSYLTAILNDSNMFEQRLETNTQNNDEEEGRDAGAGAADNIAATILSALQQQLAYFENSDNEDSNNNNNSAGSRSSTTTSSTSSASSSTTYQPSLVEPTIQEFTNKMYLFFLQASASVQTGSANNAQAFQELLQQASTNVNVSTRGLAMVVDKFVEETASLARENGLDVGLALEHALDETKDMIHVGTTVLVQGYVSNDHAVGDDHGDVVVANNTTTTTTAKPLFADYDAAAVSSDVLAGSQAGVMARLAGCVYEPTMEEQAKELGHTIVASGATNDVSWLVTDGVLAHTPEVGWRDHDHQGATAAMLVRTITLKGFDAGDEGVDRERLLGNIWTATPERLAGRVHVHSGLLSVARKLYEEEFCHYLDGLAPSHKIILNGHSIGGSLSNLLLLLITKDKGADWVKQHVLRVFTFGAPPIACYNDDDDDDKSLDTPTSTQTSYNDNDIPSDTSCNILSSFQLPSNMVHGFIQPWDPCVRLFSAIDPLYPLLDDIGADGNTLWASGPTRTLRPMVRSIVESWENWPTLRDRFRQTANQQYVPVGVQHLLMPDASRYLTDRLVSVNLNVPTVDTVVTLPPPGDVTIRALEEAFPLDTFAISYVPAAVRSFIHHFHPAYVASVDEYCKQEKNKRGNNNNKTKDNGGSSNEDDDTVKVFE